MAWHSSWFLERPNRTAGSFEMVAVCPPPDRGIVHMVLDAVVSFTWPEIWREASRICSSSSVGPFRGAAMCRTSYGNLEVIIAAVDGTLAHFWRSENVGWRGPVRLPGPAAAGPPAFIQSRFGEVGSFEVIVPGPNGLTHLWRDNGHGANVVWRQAQQSPSTTAGWSGVACLHSSYGNLELVGVRGGNLVAAWQNGPGGAWTERVAPIDTDTVGRPALLQSTFGQAGNFEVVVAKKDGGLAHYWRNNDNAAVAWSPPTLFGPASVKFDDVAMIQSSCGALEVIARVAGRPISFKRFRRSAPDAAWDGPVSGPSVTWDP